MDNCLLVYRSTMNSQGPKDGTQGRDQGTGPKDGTQGPEWAYTGKQRLVQSITYSLTYFDRVAP